MRVKTRVLPVCLLSLVVETEFVRWESLVQALVRTASAELSLALYEGTANVKLEKIVTYVRQTVEASWEEKPPLDIAVEGAL